MQTITLGKTRYVTMRDDILTHHAKCTGKHRKLKSKGAETRLYPPFGASMSTADYVAAYETLNAKKNLAAWGWQPLSTTLTVADGIPWGWEADDAAPDL